jgi:hypothetical protein
MPSARFALSLALLFAVPLSASAQNEIRARAATITVGGRLHTQYSASSVSGAQDDFFFRRARISLDILVNDFLDGKIEPDFMGGRAQLQDTFFRLTFAPQARVSIGIFKRAFSTFDVSSSTDLPTIERTGVIEGLNVCPGVEGICSFSQIAQELDLDGRDMGLRLEGSSGRFVYLATATNGPGNNVPDVNDAKSLSGRLGFRITDDLLVSGFAAAHDALDDDDETQYYSAFGGDLEFGTWRDGVHVLAGVAAGENYLIDDVPQFLTGQLLASWYLPMEGTRFVGFEPHLRVSWGDGDRSESDDAGVLATPGFMIYVFGKNGIAADLDYYRPETGNSELSFKVQTFLYF